MLHKQSVSFYQEHDGLVILMTGLVLDIHHKITDAGLLLCSHTSNLDVLSRFQVRELNIKTNKHCETCVSITERCAPSREVARINRVSN